MHTANSLKNKSYCIFIYIYIYIYAKNENSKYILARILALITNLLKSRELGQYFKIFKKIILFSFNIWGYDLICKTYSGY
jgi:hypothetical protein